MPSEVVLGSIYAAVKALLAANTSLTALISTKPLGGAAIYDEGGVVQAATMPYLAIGAGTQVPNHTMGGLAAARYGWNCTFQIKATGQGSEAAGLAIMSQVASILKEGTSLGLAGYAYSFVDEFTMQPTIVTTQAAVITREWPAILRVQCHD